MAELAFTLPVAGALLVSLLHERRRLAIGAGLIAGTAGLVAALLISPGREDSVLGLTFRVAPAGRAILIASFATAALALLLVPAGADRRPILLSLLAGLAGLGALAALTDPVLAALVLLVLAGLQSSLPAFRSFSSRFRAPAFGALLLLLGAVAAAGAAGPTLSRVAGLATVLGAGAAIGIAPYLQRFDPREPAPASAVAWLGFLGPSLAVLVAVRLLPLLPGDSAAGYSAVLISLGIFNLMIGAYGAWHSRPDADLWRYSFLGDWGLVLVGLGLLDGPAGGGAYLVLANILLLRLPLYLLARPALARGEPLAPIRPLTLVVAVALAGAAPFGGFPARLLLFRGASEVAWPIAAVLVLAMLALIPQSLRLAQTVGRGPRVGAGLLLVLAINLGIGLDPGLALQLFGVR